MEDISSSEGKSSSYSCEVNEDKFHIAAEYRTTSTGRLLSPIITNQEIRKERVFRVCRDNMLPADVVPPNTLFHHLQNLTQNLEKFDQRLVTPFSDFACYYQLNIVECTFTRTIHVNIPIKNRKKKRMATIRKYYHITI